MKITDKKPTQKPIHSVTLYHLCFRIQNNYLALQRINQDLEDKLYRMVSHHK